MRLQIRDHALWTRRDQSSPVAVNADPQIENETCHAFPRQHIWSRFDSRSEKRYQTSFERCLVEMECAAKKEEGAKRAALSAQTRHKNDRSAQNPIPRPNHSDAEGGVKSGC